MKKRMYERVAMINVPTSAGRANWIRCFNLTAKRAGVFGINETLTKSAKQTYKTWAWLCGFKFYGLNQGPNPIFWKKKNWHFVDGAHVHLHGRGPRYRQWSGFNDDRYMTVVVLQKKNQKGKPFGPKHCFLFTHWAATNPNKVPTDWVEEKRRDSIEHAQYFIDLALERGMIVWFSGDTNFTGDIDFGPRFKWIKGGGIDKVGVGVPKGIRLVKSSFELYPAPTDHDDGISVEGTFEYSS